MASADRYLLAADALLLLHAAIVVFIVVSLPLIVIGGRRCWGWVRNPWYRTIHLVAIAWVVLQAWLGEICPLTRWEMQLRRAAGEAGYTDSFIQHWLGTLLYHDLPAWVFVLLYSVFGAAVMWAWRVVRPRAFGSG